MRTKRNTTGQGLPGKRIRLSCIQRIIVGRDSGADADVPSKPANWRTFGVAVAVLVMVGAVLPVDVNAQENAKLPDNAIARLALQREDTKTLDGVYRAVISPDGKLLATRSADQIVHVWEIKSGKTLCEIDGHVGLVTGLAFTPDGKQIVTSSPGEHEFKLIWDARTGEQVMKIPGGARHLRLRCVDDRKFASFDMATGAPIASGIWLLQQSDFPLAMSHDGQRIATKNLAAWKLGQFQIMLRPVDTPSQDEAIALTSINADPVSGDFSSDGQYFSASFRGQNHVLLWRVDQPERSRSLTGHTQQIQSIAFSQDGRLLATASWDATVRIWEVLTAQPVATLAGHSEHVCAVGFSPDDRLLASGASGRTDNSTLIWDTRRALFDSSEKNEPDAEALAGLWKNLASSDPQQAFSAIGNLIRVPEQAIELFQKEVNAVTKAIDQDNLKQLIRDLDDDRFDVRESAHEELLRLRAVADVLLQQTLKDGPSAEVQYRITRILATPVTESPMAEDEMFRLRRMIYAIELIGSGDAQRQLAALSTGHPNVAIMRDAGASLQRLTKAAGA